jgi:hypothetical protein
MATFSVTASNTVTATDPRISYSLGAATDLVLTALTGDFSHFPSFNPQCFTSWADMVDPA